MQKVTNYLSQSSTKVFVGIDVHHRTYKVSCHIDGVEVKKWNMTAIPQKLAQQLNSFFPGKEIYSVYETGFSGFSLHRVLDKAGIKNIVVHAGYVESNSSRVKTDQKDARKLSRQLASQNLKGARVPSIEEESKRLLHRTRQQIVRHRSSLKIQIRMKLHQFGLIPADEKREMTRSLLSVYLNMDIPAELKFSLEIIGETLD